MTNRKFCVILIYKYSSIVFRMVLQEIQLIYTIIKLGYIISRKESMMRNTVIICASLNSESCQTLLLEQGLNLLYSYKRAQKIITG